MYDLAMCSFKSVLKGCQRPASFPRTCGLRLFCVRMGRMGCVAEWRQLGTGKAQCSVLPNGRAAEKEKQGPIIRQIKALIEAVQVPV